MAIEAGSVHVRIKADASEFLAAVRHCEHSLALSIEIRRLSAQLAGLTLSRARLRRHRLLARWRLRREWRALTDRLHERRATLDMLGNA